LFIGSLNKQKNVLKVIYKENIHPLVLKIWLIFLRLNTHSQPSI